MFPSRLIGEIEAPPSKSYTHRAYAAALLSHGSTRIANPLRSRDTDATLRSCILLGAETRDMDGGVILEGGDLKTPEDVIDVENSGTTLRLFTAISSLIPRGYAILTGDESIRRRPMKPLLDALKDLGAECWSSKLDGTAPIIVRGGGLRGGETRISGEVSSQFISALLYASTRSRLGARIIVEGDPVSKPYIDASIEVLKRFGFKIRRDGYSVFEVDGCQSGRPCDFRIPGDFSSAAFFLAGACLTEGDVRVRGLDPRLPQADSAIIDFLSRFGGCVEYSGDVVRVWGAGVECGGELDLRDCPDLLPLIAVLAARSRDRVIIRGVGHARFKESDRLDSMAVELRKLGVEVKVLDDGLEVRGAGRLRGGCVLDAHGDHRVFMALTILAASTSEGCIIEGAETIEISYPQFLEHARILGLRFEVI